MNTIANFNNNGAIFVATGEYHIEVTLSLKLIWYTSRVSNLSTCYYRRSTDNADQDPNTWRLHHLMTERLVLSPLLPVLLKLPPAAMGANCLLPRTLLCARCFAAFMPNLISKWVPRLYTKVQSNSWNRTFDPSLSTWKSCWLENSLWLFRSQQTAKMFIVMMSIASSTMTAMTIKTLTRTPRTLLAPHNTPPTRPSLTLAASTLLRGAN
jgi:hypothetical protein